jgi:type II restriction enzyme
MDLSFDLECASNYTSWSQKIRVMSERWLRLNQFCPACGRFPLHSYKNNRPVADFFCSGCDEQYELKSQRGTIGRTIADGAYRTMIDRITGNSNPNFLFLSYSRSLNVSHLQLIPKHFLSVQAIKQRKPLAESARRAGWQGCNILLDEIAASGRIPLVKGGEPCPKTDILQAWKNTLFLRSHHDLAGKSWLLSIMRCIDRLGKASFNLAEVYGFESELAAKFPSNRNVRPKIRQQLQVLRDNGYLEFLGDGKYSCIAKS